MGDSRTAQQILQGNQADFEKELEEADRQRTQALILLSQETLASVQKLVELREHPKPEIALDASKHIIKLSGLEIDRLKLNDDADVPLTVVIKQFERKRVKLPQQGGNVSDNGNLSNRKTD